MSNDAWQREVRSKITDLVEYLSAEDGVGMNAFSIDFIDSISGKLKNPEVLVSPKQYELIWDLWDRFVGRHKKI